MQPQVRQLAPRLTSTGWCFYWIGTMMINPQKKLSDTIAETLPAEVNLENAEAMYGHLTKAAEIAAKAGLPPEAFTAAAWHSYLAASPELAARLAAWQFESALEELRSSGRLAKA